MGIRKLVVLDSRDHDIGDDHALYLTALEPGIRILSQPEAERCTFAWVRGEGSRLFTDEGPANRAGQDASPKP